MNERDFVYWLQGFLELNEESDKTESLTLDAKQVSCIKEHLNLVMTKVTTNANTRNLPTSTRLPGTGRIC